MKRILLILSPSRLSSGCVDAALAAAAKENGELVALFILDTSISEDVQDRLQNLGFLGETPSGQLLAAMRSEQERQGRDELARVRRIAEERGIVVRTEFAEGEFLSRSLEAARQESADAIFVTRRARPAISRLVTGSPVASLQSSAPCRVLVHKRGGSDT